MKQITKVYLKRNRIIEMLKKVTKSKITYISAPTGCGKTIAVKQYEEKTKNSFEWVDCSKTEEIKKLKQTKKTYIVFENFNKVKNSDKEKIIKYINKADNKYHFIINSRKPVDKNLKKYFYENNLIEINIEDISFTKEETRELFKINNLNISENKVNAICEELEGYAIATNLIIMYLKENDCSQKIFKTLELDIFEYMNYNIFGNLKKDLLDALIKISFINKINIKIVNYILEIENGKEILEKIKYEGSFLEESNSEYYEIIPIVKKFLKNKAEGQFSSQEINDIYLKIANYYSNKEKNAIYASEYYILAKQYEKAADILQEEEIEHLGIVDYKEIEKYIIQIPQNIIEKYPKLCISMAHIYRLNGKKDEESKWFQKFNKIKKKYDKKTEEYNLLEQLEIYYKICQPDVNDIKLADGLKILSKITKGTSTLLNITFTGNQPSILSGGKDLSNWGKHYKIMYKLIKPLVLFLFKDKQRGSGEIAIAENLYQRNEIDKSIEYITLASSESTNVDNLFVINSLINKIKLVKNEPNNIINKFEEKIKQENAWYLTPNYEARLIENEILNGNKEKIESWLDKDAPDIVNNFNLLERYQYFTMVRAYISLEKYTDALITLEILKKYIYQYKRKIYIIEYNILKAICYYKNQDKENQKIQIENAILEAEKFNYIRLFADEGIIVYKILKENEKELLKNKNINKKFYCKIKEQAKEYGELYNNKYNINKKEKELTKKEKEIIELIKEGKSNKEISEILNVSIATVKTHINHIYAKLNTRNRIQTINKLK